MTAPHRWETTSRMVRQKIDDFSVTCFPNPFSSLGIYLSIPAPFCSVKFLLIHPTVLCVLGLKQLLDAQQLCDVTLLVEGKKFMCHRYDHHILT